MYLGGAQISLYVGHMAVFLSFVRLHKHQNLNIYVMNHFIFYQYTKMQIQENLLQKTGGTERFLLF